MALTCDFKDTIKARAERDPEFRKALVEEACDCLLNNDFETAKSLIRDYINATIGFDTLAQAVGTPEKSLMRMFGPRGNPQTKSLLPVIAYIWERERISA